MKLTAVSNNQIRQRQQTDNKNKNIAFTSAGAGLVNFWKFIDSSRGIQFTVEDMLGTNIPRTYKGAMSGYKYTGKVNVRALAQEAIREFLTGPTMTCAPIAILGVMVGLSGKTANVHRENINNLSYLVKQTSETIQSDKIQADLFKQEYFTTVVKDMLEQSTKKEAQPDDIKTLVDGIKNYDLLSKSAKSREQKKNLKAFSDELQKTFEGIIKSRKDSFKDTNFRAAKYTINKNSQGAIETGTKNFTNYIGYVTSFAQDYIKKNQKNNTVDLTEKTIEAFKKNWVGKRVITLASMVMLTGVIMSFIPKLYTLASGKENPNGQGVYAEAQKRGGK